MSGPQKSSRRFLRGAAGERSCSSTRSMGMRGQGAGIIRAYRDETLQLSERLNREPDLSHGSLIQSSRRRQRTRDIVELTTRWGYLTTVELRVPLPHIARCQRRD